VLAQDWEEWEGATDGCARRRLLDVGRLLDSVAPHEARDCATAPPPPGLRTLPKHYQLSVREGGRKGDDIS
jgi:hypothetical protein